jgi:type II secretory pathway pseudopilin PulG
MTLIEVMVTLSIMGLVMMIFTTSVVQMFRAANKSESIAEAQKQINIMFLRLDKEIRYASAISVPVLDTNGWHVRYLKTDVQTETPTCNELRLGAAAALEYREWVYDASPGTAWTVLASSVAAPPDGQPFTRLAPGVTADVYQLRLALVATSGTGETATRSDTAVTFSALNAHRLSPGEETSNDDICDPGGG